jgi:Ca2+-binding EF-hand superfamily protein
MSMRCLYIVIGIVLAGSAFSADAPLRTVPKVSTRTTILKNVDSRDAEKESVRLREFVREMIEAKEKRANDELKVMLAKIREEENARIAAEKERRRRQENYEGSWGTLSRSGKLSDAAPSRIRLDFQVPEIESYRRATDAARHLETLANDVLATLPRLDRDGDGRLALDEYREATAMVVGSTRIFGSLDGRGDGLITDTDLEAVKNSASTAAAATKSGKTTAEAAGYKLKTYDGDSDGVLDVEERKALTMAFVEAALRWKNEAEFYSKMADGLLIARQVVAAKFADVEVNP